MSRIINNQHTQSLIQNISNETNNQNNSNLILQIGSNILYEPNQTESIHNYQLPNNTSEFNSNNYSSAHNSIIHNNRLFFIQDQIDEQLCLLSDSLTSRLQDSSRPSENIIIALEELIKFYKHNNLIPDGRRNKIEFINSVTNIIMNEAGLTANQQASIRTFQNNLMRELYDIKNLDDVLTRWEYAITELKKLEISLPDLQPNNTTLQNVYESLQALSRLYRNTFSNSLFPKIRRELFINLATQVLINQHMLTDEQQRIIRTTQESFKNKNHVNSSVDISNFFKQAIKNMIREQVNALRFQ